MNKYQEALEWYAEHTSFNQFNIDEAQWADETLQELVDRATPKKPPKHDKVVCPTCNSKANYGHPYTEYCCHCGQRIDWSKEDD